jgi:hypothetical protein
MIINLLQKLFDAANRQDEECFNTMFSQVFCLAKVGVGLADAKEVSDMFGSVALNCGGHLKKQWIGTRMFGNNYGIMTKECDDFSVWVVKKYHPNNKEIESYIITK